MKYFFNQRNSKFVKRPEKLFRQNVSMLVCACVCEPVFGLIGNSDILNFVHYVCKHFIFPKS